MPDVVPSFTKLTQGRSPAPRASRRVGSYKPVSGSTRLRGTRPQDRDSGLGDFPPSVSRFGIALAIRKFGLFEQPIDGAGAAVFKRLAAWHIEDTPHPLTANRAYRGGRVF